MIYHNPQCQWRPLWFDYPEQEETFSVETSYFIGDALLVTPVTEVDVFGEACNWINHALLQPGANTVQVFFPGDQPFYDIETKQVHNPAGNKVVAAPLRKIAVFQRGGSIIPRKLRPRRAASLMVCSKSKFLFFFWPLIQFWSSRQMIHSLWMRLWITRW